MVLNLCIYSVTLSVQQPLIPPCCHPPVKVRNRPRATLPNLFHSQQVGSLGCSTDLNTRSICPWPLVTQPLISVSFIRDVRGCQCPRWKITRKLQTSPFSWVAFSSQWSLLSAAAQGLPRGSFLVHSFRGTEGKNVFASNFSWKQNRSSSLFWSPFTSPAFPSLSLPKCVWISLITGDCCLPGNGGWQRYCNPFPWL